MSTTAYLKTFRWNVLHCCSMKSTTCQPSILKPLSLPHNVTSFPFDLSAQFTPTVSQQTVDDFREAGKLSSYFPVTINKFDSSSHTGLYQDLMWYKGFCDMDRSDKYFLLITDQNLYVRIVKVCYYLSLLQHTQGGCQSGTIILIYNLKQ